MHKKDFEKDVVYLYQFGRTPALPSLSPYCLKVETWLKLQGIKYEVRRTRNSNFELIRRWFLPAGDKSEREEKIRIKILNLFRRKTYCTWQAKVSVGRNSQLDFEINCRNVFLFGRPKSSLCLSVVCSG